MTESMNVIGKRLPLEDARKKVTGKLKFAGDIRVEGTLHAKILRSPYPHARILSIDTTKAEALPGVKAVITHKDAPPDEWVSVGFSYKVRALDSKVRFVGDEVAAVAAISVNIAEEALNLIDVEYEELPHVFDMEEAMKPGAPQVCPNGNVRNPSILEWGNLEKGFKEADLVVEHNTRMGSQQHAPLDRNACVANWEDDKLTLWTGTQTPSQLRDELAKFLKMPYSKVRIIGLPLGGSFGLWWANRFHLLTVLLARKAKRPVRLELTREEVFATTKRRELPISWAKLGVKKDGTFTAIHFKHIFDNGAHGFKSDPYQMVADLWGGRTPNGKFECYGVSTNLVTGGCMRGIGGVTLGFCMEQLIDEAAEKLGIDPITIRLKNCIRTGDPIRMKVFARFPIRDGNAPPPVFPPRYLSGSHLKECIEKGAEIIHWKDKWKGWGKPTEVNGTKRRGLGMGVGQVVCSIASLGAPGAVVRINHDGSIYLYTGAGRQGQGTETTQAQIAAEELGVPADSITGVHGDTENCPWCMPIYGDLGTHMLGLATKAAAADAKQQLISFAAEEFKAKPEEIDIKDGKIFIKNQPDKKFPISYITGAISPPSTIAPPVILGDAGVLPPYTPIAATFLAHFAEVEVDTETGEVKVIRYVAVQDSGRIINPEICENQVAGGVRIGCGIALTESLVFDPETGQVLNPNYVDYRIPRAMDLPDIEVSFVEEPDPVGPFGAKGLGEAPVDGPCAVLTQAIYNAAGIKLNYVPATPERVLAALKTKTAK